MGGVGQGRVGWGRVGQGVWWVGVGRGGGVWVRVG